ncbi:MAG: phosphate regulon sensor kinase PhoR [Frankiales bacterium]|nr:phosphate regulon sensor kinase PhoR [Frankiales bacterium]
MEPGVPFALLGAVQLLAVAASLGLAAAALLRRSAAGVVVAVGGGLLAAVDVDVALSLGEASSDSLALLRGSAALLLAAGLATGGLGVRRLSPSAYGVVVPLAATGGPATFAGVASLLAAGAALWHRRDAIGAWVTAGLALWAGAAFAAPLADTGGGGPIAVLGLRGLGAAALLVGLVIMAQASLLTKVVTAILAGVLAMGVAAVGVVGTAVVSSYDDQARQTVSEAASARLTALSDLGESTRQTAGLFVLACGASTRCDDPSDAANLLKALGAPGVDDFLVRVPATGRPVLLAQRSAGIGASVLLGLKAQAPVQYVLRAAGAARPQEGFQSPVRLAGSPPSLAVVGVAGVTDVSRPQAAPASVYVYGVVLDTQYARRSLNLGGYGLFLLSGDPLQVVAADKSSNQAQRVMQIAQQAGVAGRLPEPGRTVGSEGSNPTVAFLPVRELPGGRAIGVLAVSRDAGDALLGERQALRLLVITSLSALLVVALAALVLGRRTVEPVRQLTAAAKRVARGDLTATTGLRGRDEVGTLSRTFDDMTDSLGRLTGDLRDSAARLETVLASMTDGLLATDADGIVTSVNRAALEMLCLEEPDVLGERLQIVADVRDASGGPLADPHLVLRDEPGEVHRPDGSTLPVRVAITPLQGVEGSVLVLRDTTREREVERMKTEFLSNVSHELRTPLTPIRGYAEILVGKPGLEPEKVTAFAKTIRDESLKMNRVVDLLVDVAALEAGRLTVSPRPVSVKDLLEVRLDAWQSRAPSRREDLKRRVAAGLPAVHVDPTWVGKALDEFLDNAVKYTPAGTPITLTAAWSPDGTRVRVGVKDAGPGIAEDDQGALFSSFEQVDGSATRRVGGLGLGLSFVRRLAEDAGFPLTVTTRLGRGSEFALDLPVSDQPPPSRTTGPKR